MKNSDRPAFVNDKNYQLGNSDYEGLTKREYFAAMAMQGLLANTNNSRNPVHAKDAVFLADALLEELE